MELREWKYMNTPTTGSASSTSSNANNKSFKKRFGKLINYYGQHLPKEIDFVYVNLLTSDTLDFTENFNDGDKARFNISINPATEAWSLKYYVNGGLVDSISDTGWPELLKTLYVGYIDELPHAGTPEYNSLLTEWVAMNNKTSSTGYKKRFEKLIKYHIDHASSELESITKKDIKDDGFRLSEHYDNGHHEFDRDIVVSYDKSSDTFMLRIFVDSKEVDSILRKGYEAFVTAAEGYMFLPDEGTQEYDDLLVEWVVMKNNNSSSPTSTSSSISSKTNKEKFKELLQYMVDHKLASVLTVDISKVDENGFTYRELRQPVGLEPKYELATIVNYGYGQNNSSWQVSVYKRGRNIDVLTGEGWEELLGALDIRYNVPAPGSPEHKSICESASIAEDFKLYENLWD